MLALILLHSGLNDRKLALSDHGHGQNERLRWSVGLRLCCLETFLLLRGWCDCADMTLSEGQREWSSKVMLQRRWSRG